MKALTSSSSLPALPVLNGRPYSDRHALSAAVPEPETATVRCSCGSTCETVQTFALGANWGLALGALLRGSEAPESRPGSRVIEQIRIATQYDVEVVHIDLGDREARY